MRVACLTHSHKIIHHVLLALVATFDASFEPGLMLSFPKVTFATVILPRI